MANTSDAQRTKLTTWRANHPEFGTFNSDVMKQWWVQQLVQPAEARWSPANRDVQYAAIATAQVFSLGTSTYLADRENQFWNLYTAPVLP
jgi:hypothetical protein